MNIDTTPPRETPERPFMPVLEMCFNDWTLHYERDLSDFYHAVNGKYGEGLEWNCYLRSQYDYQLTIDGYKEEPK